MYKIDKQFSFCYGHRVWSQQLIQSYCESGDTACKCRHLHGHEALVHVFLESDNLERGMVTDFKHLGWLKNFLDDNLDHKFIIDLNDPWFNNIVNVEPVWNKSTVSGIPSTLSHLKPRIPFNTSDEPVLQAIPVYVPGTKFLAGYKIDASEMSGPEREFFEGFFLTTFLPTSEHFSQWIFKIAQAKMSLINVQVSRVDWFETPKSRSSYSESDK